MRSSAVALSIILGDFNFAADPEGRLTIASGVASGRKDVAEENDWESLSKQKQIQEMYQPHFTHASAFARSRIDWVYTNIHPSEMLDKNIHASVLEWVQHLSAHRAVVFSKSKAAPTEGSKPIKDSTYMRPDFARRVEF